MNFDEGVVNEILQNPFDLDICIIPEGENFWFAIMRQDQRSIIESRNAIGNREVVIGYIDSILKFALGRKGKIAPDSLLTMDLIGKIVSVVESDGFCQTWKLPEALETP